MPAALRAVRASVVVAGLFALSSEVIANPQVATFTAFGGFSTLVLAAFGGGRRDKLIAHLGLALAGSVVLVIGMRPGPSPRNWPPCASVPDSCPPTTVNWSGFGFTSSISPRT